MSALLVSVIQSRLHWEEPAQNRRMFEEKIRALPATELVVLPEMFSTGFSMNVKQLAETMDGDTVHWMQKLSTERRIVLAGSVMISDNGKFYNRLICMMPNGQMAYYDKRHLFAFGEEDKYYTPGAKRCIASINGWKINLQVCYDLRFPVWSRQQIIGGENNKPEFDLLLYVANWPAKRNHAWKTLLCARAIENQSYVIGVNRVGQDGNGNEYSGDTQIIDPLGEILYNKTGEEDSFTIALKKEDLLNIREKFPFLKDADHFRMSS